MSPSLSVLPPELTEIDFEQIPREVNHLLKQGVVAYRTSRGLAERLFRAALAKCPEALPAYFCIYKIHAYRGDLNSAVWAAEEGLKEAIRQSGLPENLEEWQGPIRATDGPLRFVLYTLKALSFIHLRRGALDEAKSVLQTLMRLDPAGQVGWPVLGDLVGSASGTPSSHYDSPSISETTSATAHA